MIRRSLFCGAILIINFINQTSIFAQVNSPPEFRIDEVYIPKYLPPHPAYFLKTARDNLKLFATFNKVEKTQFHLDLANKRVLEIVGVIQNENFNHIANLVENYQKNWQSFFNLMTKMKIDEFDAPSQKARRNFANQKEILNYLIKSSPPEIAQKLDNSLKVQTEQLNSFFNQYQGIDQIEKFQKELIL